MRLFAKILRFFAKILRFFAKIIFFWPTKLSLGFRRFRTVHIIHFFEMLLKETMRKKSNKKQAIEIKVRVFI